MSTSIIELKQSDGFSAGPGTWNNTLRDIVTLDEGDSLSMHSAFLDTVSVEDSQINIAKGGIDAEMKFFYYNRMVNPNHFNNDEGVNASVDKTQPAGDNMLLLTEISGGEEVETIFGFNWGIIDNTHDTGMLNYKTLPFDMYWQYTDLNGKVVKNGISTKAKAVDGGVKNGESFRAKTGIKAEFGWGMSLPLSTTSVPVPDPVDPNPWYLFVWETFPIKCKPGSFKMLQLFNTEIERGGPDDPNDDPQFAGGGTCPDGHGLPGPCPKFTTVGVSGPKKEFVTPLSYNINPKLLYQPKVGTLKFNVPEGKYTSQEIAALISLRCQESSSTSQVIGKEVVNNDFLIEAGDQSDLNGDYNKDYFVYNAGSLAVPDIKKFQTNVNLWTGASTVTMSWDANANKFLWSFLHTPVFPTAPGGSIGVGIAIGRSQDYATNFFITSACGVLLNSLEPISFWYDTLGFDNSLLTNSYPVVIPTPGVPGEETTYYLADYVPGVNTVQALVINDISIEKKTDPTVVPTSVTETTSNLTTEIPAKNAIFNSSTKSSGYYYIEISGSFRNNFYGTSENFTSIFGVASNYYNLNSYLSVDGSSGWTYVHKGASVQLTNFKIRILDSNKKVASNIGLDNSIFLNFLKADIIAQIEAKSDSKTGAKESK